jgi:AraC-like DNA-binding protein
VAAYSDLIARDYRKERGVADYANTLGVTATHLTRCCNQTCGKSALALLRDRINYEACVLLRETQTPVNEIAAQLGFASAAYFTRSFASQTGITPSDFRKHGAATQQFMPPS